MNCLIIAGEKSGEEHALTFLPQLKTQLPDLSFYGVGGDDLLNAGVELLYHINDFCAWGVSEVLFKLPYYIKALNRIEEEVVRRKTKVAILIDFQDFNMRLAQRLKKHGVKVLYYVAPTAWIWRENRAYKLANSIHTLFVLLPFEKEWFLKRGVKNVVLLKHPLLTTHENNLTHNEVFFNATPKILLLPGSRKFEVQTLLPVFQSAIRELRKKYKIEVSLVRAESIPLESMTAFAGDVDEIVSGIELATYLKKADFAIAASGTVTLTAALYSVPTIVCYKLSIFNELMFRLFVRYFGPVSLPNIIHKKMVLPELLQQKMTVENIVNTASLWLQERRILNDIKKELNYTKELLVGENVNVCSYILKVITDSKHEEDKE